MSLHSLLGLHQPDLMASRWDETNIMYAAHPGALAPAFARACCMISEDICVLPAGHPCQID